MFKPGDKVRFDPSSKINIDDPPEDIPSFPDWFKKGLVGTITQVTPDDILVFLQRGDVEVSVIKERLMFDDVGKLKRELEELLEDV